MAKQNETPLAAIDESKTEFSLTFQVLVDIKAHCDILKDFFNTSLTTLRKLHKNSKIIAEIITALQEEGELINQRKAEIEKRVLEFNSSPQNADKEGPELKKKIEEVKDEIKKFNKKQHEVELYTVSITDFPSERDKFGKKVVGKGQQFEHEIDYVTSYLELLGTVITDTE